MVDYFYNGFETNNIPAGMKVLQPYLEDLNCITNKIVALRETMEQTGTNGKIKMPI